MKDPTDTATTDVFTPPSIEAKPRLIVYQLMWSTSSGGLRTDGIASTSNAAAIDKINQRLAAGDYAPEAGAHSFVLSRSTPVGDSIQWHKIAIGELLAGGIYWQHISTPR